METFKAMEKSYSHIQYTNMAHNLIATPTYITLPITMPGTKAGDSQQTVQIQVLNPNLTQPIHSKFPFGPIQFPINNCQNGTTVLTVAYNNHHL